MDAGMSDTMMNVPQPQQSGTQGTLMTSQSRCQQPILNPLLKIISNTGPRDPYLLISVPSRLHLYWCGLRQNRVLSR